MWPQIPLVARSISSPMIVLATLGILTAGFGSLGLWFSRHISHDQDDQPPASKPG